VKKADALALSLLGGLTLIFFGPVTLNRGWIPQGGGDLVSFLWPTYSYTAQSFWSGRLPLWNPTLYAGAPFAADNQSGAFYPLNWLAFLLAPNFPYLAIEGLVIAQVWLAGANMYALLRVCLADAARAIPAALFAAIAYMFSDVFITHIGNLNIIAVAAWLPLGLATFYLSLTRRSVKWALVSGSVLGIAALAGHAQMTLIFAGALGLVALWGMALAMPRFDLVPLGLVIIVFGVAIGLSAVALLPAIELTAYTARARLTYSEASQYSWPWAGVAGLLSPALFGRGAAQFWGPWERVELGYAGFLPLSLAAYAFARQRRALAGLAVLIGGIGLLIALGQNTPIHYWLYTFVPGFAQLRVPARFILLVSWAVSLLGGLGLAQIGERRRTLIWPIAFGSVALSVSVISYRLVGIAHPDFLQASLIIIALNVVASMIIIARAHTAPNAFVWLAVGLLALDLIGQGAGVEVDWVDPTLGFQHPAALEFLKNQPGPTRIDNASSAWAPDAAARFGLEDINGIHNPLGLATYQTYLGAVGARGTPLYNFLNAQFVIADKDRPPADNTFIPVFNEDPTLDIYLNTQAMARVSLVLSATSVANGEAAFGAIHASDFDPARSVIVENGPTLAGGAALGATNVYYLDYQPEQFAVIAQTPAPAYVVFSEVAYPGWRAWVDGVEAPVYRANFAFRAIYLAEPGEHHVVLRFEPLSFKIGLSVSVLTMMILIGAVAHRLKSVAAIEKRT